MVTGASPDWLPSGWTVQSMVLRSGRETRYYTNMETGKKCFSKDDVMQCVYVESTRRHKPQPTNTSSQGCSGRNHMQLIVKQDEYPDWLPDGWTMEMKTRRSGAKAGSKYKVYIDPLFGSKFYSKPEVFLYLQNIKQKSYTPEQPKNAVKSSASKVVIEECRDDSLPPGWKKEVKIKKTGAQIRRDVSYTDPVNGYVFRSRKEVTRFLETGEISKYVLKPKEKQIKDQELMNEKTLVVVEECRDDSLPPGWKKEVKIKKTGAQIRRDASYTDPVNGYVFRSRKEVTRFLETGEISKYVLKPKEKQIKDQELMNEKSLVVVEECRDDSFPPGWKKEVKIKKTGAQIRRDASYTDPVNGYVFRSRKEVTRFLETGEISKYVLKPKEKQIKDQELMNEKSLVVVEECRDDSLPPGWKKEVKIKKTGAQIRRDASYTDPVNGYVFRSRKEVTRFLETGEISKYVLKPKEKQIKDQELMNEKSLVVVEECRDDSLPPGWKKEVKIKKTGAQIRRDASYTDPVNGYVFRSRKEVTRFLETGEISKYVLKPKEKQIKDQELMNEKSLSSSADRRQKIHHPATSQQHSAAKREKTNHPTTSQQHSAGKREKTHHPATSQQHSAGNGSFDSANSVTPKASYSNKHQSKRLRLSKDTFVTKKTPVEESGENDETVNPCKPSLPLLQPVKRVSKKTSDTAKENTIEESAENEDTFNTSNPARPRARSSRGKQGKKVVTDGPLSTSAGNILQDDSRESERERSGHVKTQGKDKKSKNLNELNLPGCSSSRLAGIEPLVAVCGVFSGSSVNNESRDSHKSEDALAASAPPHSSHKSEDTLAASAPPHGSHKSEDTVAASAPPHSSHKSEDTLAASAPPHSSVDGMSERYNLRSGNKLAHHMCTNIDTPQTELLSNKRKMMPIDDCVREKQLQPVEAGITDRVKADTHLFFPSFGEPSSVPCFKTPVDCIVDMKRMSTPVSAVLQGTGLVEKSGNTKTKFDELNSRGRLPRRSIKFDHEHAANPSRSDRGDLCLPRDSLEGGANLQIKAMPSTGLNKPVQTVTSTPSNESKKALEDLNITSEPLQDPESVYAEKTGQCTFPISDFWSDPCIEFAFKTLTGAIPIDTAIHISQGQNTTGSALPVFGSPLFDVPEKPSTLNQVLPPNFSSCPQESASLRHHARK